MKVKVWYLAMDGDGIGTVGDVFATEKEAYAALIDAAFDDEQSEYDQAARAKLLPALEDEDFDKVADILDEELVMTFTYDVGEKELKIP